MFSDGMSTVASAPSGKSNLSSKAAEAGNGNSTKLIRAATSDSGAGFGSL